MTTVRQIRLAHSAGDPDDVLALRIDIIKAAQVLVDSWDTEDYARIARAEDGLDRAVEKYRRAVKRRVGKR